MRPGTLAVVGALLAAVAVGSALRYPTLYEPAWYGDEGIFAAIAHNMLEGRALYSDAWDNKPPGIFLTYAAVRALFGPSVLALHAVAMAAVLITQIGVMAIATVLYGAKRALFAGLIFAFVMGTPIIEGNLAMTETFMIVPTTLAALIAVITPRAAAERRFVCYAATGMLLGLAAAYKQVAVFDALAIALIIAFTSDEPLRPILAMVSGLAGVQAAVAVAFVATGAFPEYWYAVIGSLGLYSGLSTSGPFERLAGYLPAALVVAYLLRRRQLGGEIGMRHFPMLWLGFALAGAMSSTFAFPHYLQQAAPAFALVLVSDPLPKERDDLGRVTLAVAAVLVVAVVFGQFGDAFRDRRQLNPVEYYRTFVSHEWGSMSDLDRDYYFDGKVVAVNDITRYIEDDGAGDTLFAWSELPWLYAEGELTNPTRYYTSFLGEIVPDAKTEILGDIESSPPAYIVVSEDVYAPFPELDQIVERRYELLRAQGDWRLYRRADLNGDLAADTAASLRSSAPARDQQPASAAHGLPGPHMFQHAVRAHVCAADSQSACRTFTPSGIWRAMPT